MQTPGGPTPDSKTSAGAGCPGRAQARGPRPTTHPRAADTHCSMISSLLLYTCRSSFLETFWTAPGEAADSSGPAPTGTVGATSITQNELGCIGRSSNRGCAGDCLSRTQTRPGAEGWLRSAQPHRVHPKLGEPPAAHVRDSRGRSPLLRTRLRPRTGRQPGASRLGQGGFSRDKGPLTRQRHTRRV